ncbi:AI-2E family transporter [Psychromonas marina]|uniref:AI-2E family transporter n=1 Tax=Psychromonas marina TaxID=88364 RepID=A0ABQ6DWR4_9GAMM|nr:AI-2E family transporter [Psychromonas marina]GLS89586.1 AI-2E family transporter [Psychromonas marina]
MEHTLFTKNVIEAAIRVSLVAVVIYFCAKILQPFAMAVLWGAIIAVAIYPLFTRFKNLLGGKSKLAASLYAVIAISALITPTVMISNSLIDTSVTINEQYQSGALTIPAPSKSVAEWPLIGEKTYTFWNGASKNLENTLNTHLPQLKSIATSAFSAIAGIGGTVLQFVLSIIISAVFVASAESAYRVIINIFSRLTDAKTGKEYTDLARDTIRSVAQGVLGVAIIQALLAALGMYVMDVPAWGLWSLVILVFAIAQLPPILVLGFVISYVFSVAETTPAVIFMIYAIIVSASDGFLKPMFLGRGMETPMLVILLGAIGGMMMSGIIGLFVGAIVLALGYELFMKWLNSDVSAQALEDQTEEKNNG